MYITKLFRHNVNVIACVLAAIIALAFTLPYTTYATELDDVDDSSIEAIVEDESIDTPVDVEDVVQLEDGVRYFEVGSNADSSAVLFVSNGETLLVCSGPNADGLADALTSVGVSRIDYLVLASADGQENVLYELYEKCPIGHLYSAGNLSAVSIAADYGVDTSYSDYFYMGNECVILYADDANTLGVLVYDESHAIFVADAMTDMSVLKDHQEISLMDILSISANTGTDADVITSMNPINCIIAGETPDTDKINDFYNTNLAATGAFYVTRNTPDGIFVDLDSIYNIQNATVQYIVIEAPVTEEVVDEYIDTETLDVQEFEDANTETFDTVVDTFSEVEETENIDDTLIEETNVNETNDIVAETEEAVVENTLIVTEQDDNNIDVAETSNNTNKSEATNESTETTIVPSETEHEKSIGEVAIEVSRGLWGRGNERYNALVNAGYDYDTIQSRVDYIYNNNINNPVAITFDENGHGETPDYLIVSAGSVIDEPEELSADGFVFTGWFTDKNGENKFDFNIPVENSMVLYAGWVSSDNVDIIPVEEPEEPTEFIVYFDVNGHGDAVNPQTVLKDEFVTVPKEPKEEGFIFDGWFTEAECENSYDFNTPVTEEFTLYAGWHEDLAEYTVTFELNGHGKEIEPQTVIDGECVVRPEDPSEEGFIFNGWCADEDLMTEFDFDTPVTEDMVVYASWEEEPEPIIYTITFNMSGHGASVENQEVIEGEKVLEPAKPTEDGYRFIGWYTDALFNVSYNFNNPVHSDFTLYAKWEEIETKPETATVNFNLNGHGKSIVNQVVEIGKKAVEPATPVENGFVFDGWFTDTNGEYKYNFDAAITGDTTLYAKWHEVTYTVHYEANGGSGYITDAKYPQSKTASVENNTFVREGYTFTGWNTKADGTGTTYQSGDKLTNITIEDGTVIILYAQWREDYKILEGNGQTVYAGAIAEFHTNGKIENVTGVLIDNNPVSTATFTVRPNTTGVYITIPADYLSTLSVGEHKITVQFKDGSCEGTFLSVATAAVTGDTNNIYLYIIIVLAAIAVGFTSFMFLRKSKNHGGNN